MKSIISISIITASILLFLLFTQGNIKDIKTNKAEAKHLSSVLESIQSYQQKYEQILQKYNEIPTNNIERIEKFLPNNVDNVKLILAVQNVAGGLGVSIKNVTYDTVSSKTSVAQNSQSALNRQTKDYGIFDMNFTLTGRYVDFVNFLSEIEKSLRIVDVREVEFLSQNTKSGVTPTENDIYQFDIGLRTYWLNKVR